MMVINGQKRLGDVMRNFADTSKAKKILGWEPLMPIDEGLANTIVSLSEG